MATKSCELTNYKEPQFVDTLAQTASLARNAGVAKTNFERAVALRDKLLTADPQHRQNRVEAALQRVRFADHLAKNDDRPTARELYEYALASFDKLAEEFPDDKYYAEWMLWLNGRLGFLFEELNDLTLAERHHREVLNIYDTRIKPLSTSVFDTIREVVSSDSRRAEYAARLAKFQKPVEGDADQLAHRAGDGAASASTWPDKQPSGTSAEKVEVEDPLLFDD
jgi:tetratricopeptide (TPR) repeat protein